MVKKSTMKAHEYSMMNKCDWEWNFEVDGIVKYDLLKDGSDIYFNLDKPNKILKGFTVKVSKKDGWNSNWIALEKAKTLTNLLSVIYGEFISAKIKSNCAITPYGKAITQVMDMSSPLRPCQTLVCDLTDKNIRKILTSKKSGEILYHLSNALHNATDSPDSVIRDLILAFGDKDNLPSKYYKYWPLRNAVSHKDVKGWIKKLKNQYKKLEFNGNTLNRTSSINRTYLIMEAFLFLHNSLDDFRKQLSLITTKRSDVR